jgi:hypothetical protein
VTENLQSRDGILVIPPLNGLHLLNQRVMNAGFARLSAIRDSPSVLTAESLNYLVASQIKAGELITLKSCM